MTSPPKTAKAYVAYGDPPAAKPNEHCRQCSHFEPPNACQLVAGEIKPEKWCVWWEAPG